MRYFGALAVILIALPTGADKQQSQPAKQQATTQHCPQPTNPVIVVVNPPRASGQRDSTDTKTHNGPPIYSNWALVIVTFLAAVAALLSLHFIRMQAVSTEKAANAANNNAIAVINAERAWVMANLEKGPGPGTHSTGSDDTSVYFRLTLKNDGRTPAWITRRDMCLVVKEKSVMLPEVPDFSRAQTSEDQAIPISANGTSPAIDEWIKAEGCQGMEDDLILYGVVKYRDVFSEMDRETFFAYSVGVGEKWKRLRGYPQYNRNT